MTRRLPKLLTIASAAAVLAACSAAVSQETPNTAIVLQATPDLVADLAAAPPAPPVLDGAPTPLIVPEAVAPLPPAAEYIAPPVVAAPVEARFTCDIDVVRTAIGVRITPVVRAGRSMEGEYTLVITKTGAGGSSDISQGGPFDAARGERVSLGSSEFSLERGASFRAVLKVRADGHEICRDKRS